MQETGPVWSELERYKEVIVNSLDLMSFFLITPELLRVVRPALSNVFKVIWFSIMAMSAVAGIAGYVLVYLSQVYTGSVFESQFGQLHPQGCSTLYTSE